MKIRRREIVPMVWERHYALWPVLGRGFFAWFEVVYRRWNPALYSTLDPIVALSWPVAGWEYALPEDLNDED